MRRVHVDPPGTWAFLSTTKNGHVGRQVYRVNIQSGELKQVTKKSGFHSVALSGDNRYLVDQFSSVDTPPVSAVAKADGSDIELESVTTLDGPQVFHSFGCCRAPRGLRPCFVHEEELGETRARRERLPQGNRAATVAPYAGQNLRLELYVSFEPQSTPVRVPS